MQDGSTLLVYEMVVTNFSNNKYTLDAVEAKAGTAQFTFSGSAFADMVVPLGASGKPEGATLPLMFVTVAGYVLLRSRTGKRPRSQLASW